MMQLKHARGFTLVELMVTIAVMAIIAMMAVPSFTQTIRKSQLNSETRNFINLLAETRSEAIFKQQNKELKLNSTGGFKDWLDSNQVEKSNQSDAVTSFTYNRMGQTTETDHRCIIFEHKNDANLKTYVQVQKDGIVFYNKTATSKTIGCPAS